MEFKNYKIKDIFMIDTTNRYKYTNDYLMNKNGKTPVITNTSRNNGIGGYSKLEPLEEGNVITYSDTVDNYKTFFYQANSFIGYSHVKKLILKKGNLNKRRALYLISLLKKVTISFSFGNKMTDEVFGNLEISVPIKRNEEIDFKYMENYIKRIEAEYVTRIEAEYVTRIEAYLTTLGYKSMEDLKLSKEESDMLENLGG